MGGAIAEGNITPAAEFNIWVDPEAAARVFASGIDVTMVGLDVTHRALMTPDHAERLRAAGRVGTMVAELWAFYTATTRACTTGRRLGPGAGAEEPSGVLGVERADGRPGNSGEPSRPRRLRVAGSDARL